MPLYLVCNDKGGVGKSTFTPNLAVYLYDLGHSVAVVDADKQLHTAKHVELAEPRIPAGGLTDKKQITQALPKLFRQHDHIVADAPANLGPETRQLMTMADYVIVPTEPGLKAFESTIATYEQLLKAQTFAPVGKPKTIWVVFNKVDLRRRKHFEKYRSNLVEAGLPVLNAYIRFNAVFADCDENKQFITRLHPKGRHATAVARAQLDMYSVLSELFQSQTKKMANV